MFVLSANTVILVQQGPP